MIRAFRIGSTAALAALSLAASGMATASAPAENHWKVYDYGSKNLHAREPDALAGGVATFDFLSTPDTALILTKKGDRVGDLTGQGVTAKVGVSVATGTQFTYYGDPDGCGRPANVRFYFQTNTSGAFEETDYWWSNPVSVDLEALKSGDQTLFVAFDPSAWSDFYGHLGSDPLDAAAFAAAVKDVREIGLSFGGGCFFENGVGIVPGTGSGSFRLVSFTVAP
jgi:hypothetical protein